MGWENAQILQTLIFFLPSVSNRFVKVCKSIGFVCEVLNKLLNMNFNRGLGKPIALQTFTNAETHNNFKKIIWRGGEAGEIYVIFFHTVLFRRNRNKQQY